VESLELVPDLLLGLAGNLPAHTPTSAPKPTETAPIYRFLSAAK
jgi:hypothetical protein